MIDSTQFKLIVDIIKAMGADRYVLVSGHIIGAKVSKKKGDYNNIESIMYTDCGILLSKPVSFSKDQITELLKHDLSGFDDFELVFNRLYDNPMIINNKIINIFAYLKDSILDTRACDICIENIKENEEFNYIITNKVKYGLKFFNIDGVIVPGFKGIVKSTKKETITLSIYKNINYDMYNYNNNVSIGRTYHLVDYIVDKRKYKIHNLYRVMDLYR